MTNSAAGLKEKNLNPLVSSITYTELLYHHLKKGKDESYVPEEFMSHYEKRT